VTQTAAVSAVRVVRAVRAVRAVPEVRAALPPARPAVLAVMGWTARIRAVLPAVRAGPVGRAAPAALVAHKPIRNGAANGAHDAMPK
jgi:hypothetical protein